MAEERQIRRWAVYFRRKIFLYKGGFFGYAENDFI